jgi:hypothetical protein
MTIIASHTCLADSTERPGSYLDCGDCRDALIKSFGEPADPPVFQEPETSREVSQVIAPDDARRCPWCPGHPVYGMTEYELSLIRDHIRAVHPAHFRGWAGLPPEHATTADTEPNMDGSKGGRWVVSCTCGWSQTGRYARDAGEAPSLRLAQLKGEEHELDPDRACAYCGHPHREGRCGFCAHDNRYGR